MIGVFRHARYRIDMPIHSSDKWLSKYLRAQGGQINSGCDVNTEEQNMSSGKKKRHTFSSFAALSARVYSTAFS